MVLVSVIKLLYASSESGIYYSVFSPLLCGSRAGIHIFNYEFRIHSELHVEKNALLSTCIPHIPFLFYQTCYCTLNAILYSCSHPIHREDKEKNIYVDGMPSGEDSG